jgi:hypothetical protein
MAYVNMPRSAATPAKDAERGLKTNALVNSLSATVVSTDTIRPRLSLCTSFLVVMGNPSPSFVQPCIAFCLPRDDLITGKLLSVVWFD